MRDAFILMLMTLIQGWRAVLKKHDYVADPQDEALELAILCDKVEKFLADEFGVGQKP